MYYEIMLNGNSTTPGRALPKELIDELTSLSERLEAKAAIIPRGGILYSLYLYNTNSYESLYYFFSRAAEAVKDNEVDMICTTLVPSGRPPIY